MISFLGGSLPCWSSCQSTVDDFSSAHTGREVCTSVAAARSGSVVAGRWLPSSHPTSPCLVSVAPLTSLVWFPQGMVSHISPESNRRSPAATNRQWVAVNQTRWGVPLNHCSTAAPLIYFALSHDQINDYECVFNFFVAETDVFKTTIATQLPVSSMKQIIFRFLALFFVRFLF